jgi:hypothetical protein
MNAAFSKLLCAIVVIAFAAIPAFAVDTKVVEVTGKVEVKLPGKTNWQLAKKDMDIPKGTTISTGFKSVAVFKMDATIITCRALTRLTIEQIASSQNQVAAECYLQVGTMRAEVNKPQGGSINFTVRSPVATASVRGTVFEFDGLNLFVDAGTVAFSVNGALVRSFVAGQSTSVDSNGNPKTAQEKVVEEVTVNTTNNPVIPPITTSSPPVDATVQKIPVVISAM